MFKLTIEQIRLVLSVSTDLESRLTEIPFHKVSDASELLHIISDVCDEFFQRGIDQAQSR